MKEKTIMKKLLFIITIALFCCNAHAQSNKAEIEFETTTIDMGTFPADSAVIECAFVYTNKGDAPLYIHRVMTSCGCTGKRFPTGPLAPGEKDTIFIIYNGTNRSPGRVRKSATVHCNSKGEMVKLYIKGKMLPAKVEEIPQIDEIE